MQVCKNQIHNENYHFFRKWAPIIIIITYTFSAIEYVDGHTVLMQLGNTQLGMYFSGTSPNVDQQLRYSKTLIVLL